MRDVHAFTPGGMLVGRAKTLRFIPPRKDIIAETHRGADSPEYEAMGSCEPGDVLVIDGMGKKYAAIGGDVKLLQLKDAGCGRAGNGRLHTRPGYRCGLRVEGFRWWQNSHGWRGRD